MSVQKGSRLRIEITLPVDSEVMGPVDWTLHLWPIKAKPPHWEHVESGHSDDWITAMDEASSAITENFCEE